MVSAEDEERISVHTHPPTHTHTHPRVSDGQTVLPAHHIHTSMPFIRFIHTSVKPLYSIMSVMGFIPTSLMQFGIIFHSLYYTPHWLTAGLIPFCKSMQQLGPAALLKVSMVIEDGRWNWFNLLAQDTP